MSNKDDAREAAQQFFTLWQEQCESLSKQPDAAAMLLKPFAQWQEQFMQGLQGKNQDEKSDVTNRGAAEPAASSDATADIFRFMVDELAHCRGRIAALEERLALLESRLAGKE